MKQTAVEFLELMFLRILSFDSEEQRQKYKKAIRQAKELEKQRTIEFAKHCLDKSKDLDIITAHSKAEQYYNETYKKK